MGNTTEQEPNLPEQVSAIKECGFVTWSSDNDLSPQFKQHFDDARIPIAGIRHVRQWDVQVDDERELLGHERTTVENEELWEVILKAKDGSTYEVNSKFVTPAP